LRDAVRAGQPIFIDLLSARAHLDGHPAQLVENLTAAAQRPPFVKVDLKRTPHRDPARDGHAFFEETGDG